MSEAFYHFILPQDGLTNNNGEFYDFSYLPEIQNLIEQEKRDFQQKRIDDESYSCWDDETVSAFVHKASYEKFIESSSERKLSILSNRKYVFFPISDNPYASEEMPPYEFHSLNQVNKYKNFIEKAAKNYGVDPDLIKAIVYMETTHGYYDIPISNLLQALNVDTKNVSNIVHKSILPMNINTAYWGDYFGTREQLLDSEYNINVGTQYLAKLKTLLKYPNIEKIASLYNNLATRRINDYGMRVAKFYHEKPWLCENDPYIYESDNNLNHLLHGFLMTIIEKYPFLLK